jgi:hypothetical protein
MGMPTRTVVATRPADAIVLNNSHLGGNKLVLSLGAGTVGLREQAGAAAAPTVDAITRVISVARAKEYNSYTRYGEYAEVKEAIQAATMWNYIYTPAEYAPFILHHLYVQIHTLYSLRRYTRAGTVQSCPCPDNGTQSKAHTISTGAMSFSTGTISSRRT